MPAVDTPVQYTPVSYTMSTCPVITMYYRYTGGFNMREQMKAIFAFVLGYGQLLALNESLTVLLAVS